MISLIWLFSSISQVLFNGSLSFQIMVLNISSWMVIQFHWKLEQSTSGPILQHQQAETVHQWTMLIGLRSSLGLIGSLNVLNLKLLRLNHHQQHSHQPGIQTNRFLNFDSWKINIENAKSSILAIYCLILGIYGPINEVAIYCNQCQNWYSYCG